MFPRICVHQVVFQYRQILRTFFCLTINVPTLTKYLSIYFPSSFHCCHANGLAVLHLFFYFSLRPVTLSKRRVEFSRGAGFRLAKDWSQIIIRQQNTFNCFFFYMQVEQGLLKFLTQEADSSKLRVLAIFFQLTSGIHNEHIFRI